MLEVPWAAQVSGGWGEFQLPWEVTLQLCREKRRSEKKKEGGDGGGIWGRCQDLPPLARN